MIKPEDVPMEVVYGMAQMLWPHHRGWGKKRLTYGQMVTQEIALDNSRVAIAAALNAWPESEIETAWTLRRLILPLPQKESDDV